MWAGNRPGEEGGYLTVQFLVVTGLSLVLFVMVANVIVVQYGRGVVRAAADEGVQAGSMLEADSASCETRAGAVVASLLPGPFGSDIDISCLVDDEGRIRAAITYRFRSWVPGIPDFAGVEAATSVKEVIP